MDETRRSTLQHSTTPLTQPVEVAAGLVFRGGKLLITQRYADVHLGGLWEFPGGKRNADESFEQCLRRELIEELGIEITVGELLQEVAHDYPDKTVHLKFFLCNWLCKEPQALGCQGFAWISSGELANYTFPAADVRLLERLASSPEFWGK